MGQACATRVIRRPLPQCHPVLGDGAGMRCPHDSAVPSHSATLLPGIGGGDAHRDTIGETGLSRRWIRAHDIGSSWIGSKLTHPSPQDSGAPAYRWTTCSTLSVPAIGCRAGRRSGRLPRTPCPRARDTCRVRPPGVGRDGNTIRGLAPCLIPC